VTTSLAADVGWLHGWLADRVTITQVSGTDFPNHIIQSINQSINQSHV